MSASSMVLVGADLLSNDDDVDVDVDVGDDGDADDDNEDATALPVYVSGASVNGLRPCLASSLISEAG